MSSPGKSETPAPRQRPAARRPQMRSSGVLAWVFVGLVVLGGVAVWPTLRPIVSQLHLGRLVSAFDGSGGGTVNAPSSVIDAEQATYQPVSKTDRLEATVMALSMRLDMLERRVAKAEENGHPAADGGAEAQRLTQDMAQLRQELDAMEHTAANVRHLTERKDRSPLFLLALGHLREAVDRGGSYDAELRATAAMVGAAAGGVADSTTIQRLETIQSYAADGVETRASLAIRFHDVSEQALRTVTMAEAPPMMGRVLRWVGAAFSVRRADGTGDLQNGTVSAAILRAARLAPAGDINGVVTILQPIAGQGGEALDGWFKAASARIAVDAALSELSAATLAKTAGGE